MELIIALLLVGILLLASEVFLFSGLVGVIGVASLLGGIWLTFTHYGALIGLAVGTGSLVVTFAIIGLEIKMLPHTRAGRSMFNQSAVTGRAVNTGAATSVDLIGKAGKAITTFAPTGLAEIEGRQYEAASLDGLLSPGDALVVAGRDPYKLLVKKAVTAAS
jgi:membrane-bound ClpP family serine protease